MASARRRGSSSCEDGSCSEESFSEDSDASAETCERREQERAAEIIRFAKEDRARRWHLKRATTAAAAAAAAAGAAAAQAPFSSRSVAIQGSPVCSAAPRSVAIQQSPVCSAAAAASASVIIVARGASCHQALRHPLLLQPSAPLVPQSTVNRLWAQLSSQSFQFRLEIRASASLSRPGAPVQFGVFVARSLPARSVIPAGMFVAPYGGLLRHRLDIERAAVSLGLSSKDAKSHARKVPGTDWAWDGLPLAWMIRRPIPLDESDLLSIAAAGVEQLLPAPPLFTAAEVALFHHSPIGFLCNTASGAAGRRNNVRIEYRSVSLGGGLSLSLPILIATEDLCEGDELLSPYNNVAATSGDFVGAV